jgi:hypothetical protein
MTTTTSTTSFNASSESTPSSNYVTALEDSIYQTAATGENPENFFANLPFLLTNFSFKLRSQQCHGTEEQNSYSIPCDAT